MIRLMLTHVCNKFLSTTTPVRPRALLLSFCCGECLHIMLGCTAGPGIMGGLSHNSLCCKAGDVLAQFHTRSLVLLLLYHESSERRKPALNHHWQGGNHLYWCSLLFKGPHPFLATYHSQRRWCHPGAGFQAALLNPRFRCKTCH